ncbi:MAG: DUF1015 family protein [Phycisphaerales bacterium]
MANVYPFRPLVYADRTDLSAVAAPPYDVLDAAGKAKLLARDANNIVAVDLPHTPAKELGPQSAYDGAAATLADWQAKKLITRTALPTMFVYRQSFKSADGRETVRRTGMACCIDALPFGPRKGGGVLPHEETFSGPKQDRFALMKATRTQLSPIFGLHADDQGKATALLNQIIAKKKNPDRTATTGDGTLHELWQVQDSATLKAYEEALGGEDVFIADGHHRYNTALNYLAALEAEGQVPANHPARRVMIVLVSMSDPGLVIWPTHRVLGGMKGYSMNAFLDAAGPFVKAEAVAGDLAALDAALQSMTDMGDQRFALWDFEHRRGYVAAPVNPDALQERFPEKPGAWRELSVAFCQYVLVEQICQAKLNGGEAVKWAFPHTIKEVEDIGSGAETGAGGGKNFAQLAVIVRPTPLKAVKDVSRANQLMPQKSTFFYPKLATGLFMHGLE